jgi:hypothetical protein
VPNSTIDSFSSSRNLRLVETGLHFRKRDVNGLRGGNYLLEVHFYEFFVFA